MKVSGFTFIRNGTSLGYPFIESIKSILPICDEFIIALGKSEDNTLSKIRALKSKKIKIIETFWNESISDRGFVYAQQKMIAQYNCSGDWAFYLEGDEIVDIKDHKKIISAMEMHLNNQNVEAFAFNYHHFYGRRYAPASRPAEFKASPSVLSLNEKEKYRNSCLRNIGPLKLIFPKKMKTKKKSQNINLG